MPLWPIISSFNAGELTPLLDGRVDVGKYANGGQRIENFLPLLQGPLTRRPGTRFVAEVKDSDDRVWLGRFEFNTTQAYILELGPSYIRFFTQHGQLLASGIPYEVASPWGASDLTRGDGTLGLSFAQSADVLYIAHPAYWPRKLSRLGATSWTLTTVQPKDGPFLPYNQAGGLTLYASAETGTCTVTAVGGSPFKSTDVDRLIWLEVDAFEGIKPWEPGQSVVAGDLRRSDGKTYEMTATGTKTTGSIRPVHESGAQYDGSATNAARWSYRHAGYGIARITGFTSATVVSATILSRFPSDVVGSANATPRWRLGAWCSELGFPAIVTFWRERLVFAGGTFVDLSVVGDYESFAPRFTSQVLPDSAVRLQLVADQVNDVEWLSPADQLLVGTAGGEFRIVERTSSEPFGPDNVTVVKESEYGCRRVPPVRLGDEHLFVQRNGRKLRALRYTIESDRLIGSDLSALGEHLPRPQIVRLAYAQEPDPIVWCQLKDNSLIGLTYSREQEVVAWHRHTLGGWSNAARTAPAAVEAIESIPSPDGDRDELWLVVRREINGVTRRYVEYMERRWERGRAAAEAFYVDSGLSLDNRVQTRLVLPANGGATVVGKDNVLVETPDADTFVAGDVGRFIRGSGGYARITYFFTARIVRLTILSAFPAIESLNAGAWWLTVTSVNNVDHLPLETVAVLADGGAHRERPVSVNGLVTFDLPLIRAQVGLPYTSTYQSMRLEYPVSIGTLQGKIKRIHQLVLRFIDTLTGKAGPALDRLDEVTFRTTVDPLGLPPAPRSDDFPLLWPGGYERAARVCVVQDRPTPMTLAAVMHELEARD